MNDRVRLTVENGVADVRMIRADKMNALDQAMFDALVATGQELIGRTDVRVVVLSGEGRAFCAGLDTGRFQNMAAGTDSGGARPTDQQRLGPRTHGLSNASQYAAMVWQDVPVPVIAAVHGVAFGGGLQVALGADMRFVAADTRLSIMEIKWGLVPDMGGTLLLQGLARADIIRDLTFSGRIFSGSEAVEYGIATRVCQNPYQEAMTYARDIAAKSPDAIRAGKRLLKLAQQGDPARTLQAESDEQIALKSTPNQVEAVKAGLEKRTPNFVDVQR